MGRRTWSWSPTATSWPTGSGCGSPTSSASRPQCPSPTTGPSSPICDRGAHPRRAEIGLRGPAGAGAGPEAAGQFPRAQGADRWAGEPGRGRRQRHPGRPVLGAGLRLLRPADRNALRRQRALRRQSVIAARIRGVLKSAFAGPPALAPDQKRPDNFPEHKAQTDGPANLVVVADSDILADRFWVRVSDFFGQQTAMPFADNGPFVANL